MKPVIIIDNFDVVVKKDVDLAEAIMLDLK